MLIGEESCRQDDQNGQHQHGEVRQHDWKPFLRHEIGTGFQHELRAKCDEQGLQNIDELNQPQSNEGHHDGRMGEHGQTMAELGGVPTHGGSFHGSPVTVNHLKFPPPHGRRREILPRVANLASGG